MVGLIEWLGRAGFCAEEKEKKRGIETGYRTGDEARVF